jgi:tetratricopeptide (TPR) repeat protein
LAAQHLEEARRELEAGCRLVPCDPDVQASLARLLGEMAAAGLAPPSGPRRAWDDALALDPDNPTLLAEAGRFALFLGERDRARRLLRHGLDLYPRHAALLALLGACDYGDGRLEPAAEELEAALRDGDWSSDPEGKVRASAALAAARLAQGRFDRAEEAAYSTAMLQPDWPIGWVLLGQALEGLGRHGDALNAYRFALQHDPDCAVARLAIQRLTGSNSNGF